MPRLDSADAADKSRGVESHAVSERTSITALNGAHDLASRQRVLAALLLAIERPNVIVDLSNCSFLDTTILEALYIARRAQQPGRGRIDLVVPDHNGFVDRWSHATGVRLAMPVHATLADALHAVGESPGA